MVWRTLFFLLVFVNLLVYVWTQGYLGGNTEGREPQRLTQQFNADKIGIVRAPTTAEAPPAKKEDAACRSIAGLSTADAATLVKAVTAAGWQGTTVAETPPARHLVVIADLANKAAADKKATELRQLGVADFQIVGLDSGKQEIVLGSFDADAAAKDFLAGLTKKGIKSARAEAREQAATRARVDIHAPAEVLAKRLPELTSAYVIGGGASVGDCPAQ